MSFTTAASQHFDFEEEDEYSAINPGSFALGVPPKSAPHNDPYMNLQGNDARNENDPAHRSGVSLGPKYPIPGFRGSNTFGRDRMYNSSPPSRFADSPRNQSTENFYNLAADSPPQRAKPRGREMEVQTSPERDQNGNVISELERDLFQKSFDPRLRFEEDPELYIRREGNRVRREAQESALRDLQRNYDYHEEHGEGRVGILQLESQVKIMPHLQRISEAPAVLRIPRGVSEEGSVQGLRKERKWQTSMENAIVRSGGLKKTPALLLIDHETLAADYDDDKEEADAAAKDPYALKFKSSAKGMQIDDTRMMIDDMPRPQGVGMLSSVDLALPPVRENTASSPQRNFSTHNTSGTSSAMASPGASRTQSMVAARRKSAQSVFGRRQSRRQSSVTLKGAGGSGLFDYEFDEVDKDGNVFPVERDWRDAQQKTLQHNFYKPLKGAAVVDVDSDVDEGIDRELDEGERITINMMLSQYKSMQELDKRIGGDEDDAAARPGSPAARHKRLLDGGSAPWVPFAVRKLGHDEVKYTTEDADAKRAEIEQSRQQAKFLDQFLDVSTATVLERKYVAPLPRNYTDEEKAKNQLVAFDDDTSFTFVARRLQGFSIIEDFAAEARDATQIEAADLEEEEERKRRTQLSMLRDQRNAAMNASSYALGGTSSGGLPLSGGSKSKLFDFDYVDDEEVNLATKDTSKNTMLKRITPLVPQHVVVEDCAYTFAHDFFRAAVFQPSDRRDNLDQWRLINFRYNSYVVEDESGMDATYKSMMSHSDDDDDSAPAMSRQGTTARLELSPSSRPQIPSQWKEKPALPPPRSVIIPYCHPILGHCVFAVPTNGETTIYGVSLALADPFVPIAGCWCSIRLYGLEFAGTAISWAQLITTGHQNPVVYLRSIHRHCTADLSRLVEAMVSNHYNYNDQLIEVNKKQGERVQQLLARGNSASGSSGSPGSGYGSNNNSPEAHRGGYGSFSDSYEDEDVVHWGSSPSGSPGAGPQKSLAPGMKSAGEGIILSDADDTISIRVAMLKSNPPREKLVSMGYPTLSMTLHQKQLYDRETGQPVSQEALDARDLEQKQEALRAKERKSLSQTSKKGLSMIQRTGSMTSNMLSSYMNNDDDSAASTMGRDSSTAAAPLNILHTYNDLDDIGSGRNDEDYFFDYALGRFVTKQRNLKNQNIVKEEEHVWIWVWNGLAKNWLPWKRIDGLANPLPVLLKNHLRRPNDVMTRKGNTITTFFLAEERLRISGYNHGGQAFVSAQSKLVIQEELSEAQKALLEKEAAADETETRRLAALASRTTFALTAAERSRRQMESYQDQKQKSTSRQTSPEGGEKDESDAYSATTAASEKLGHNLTLQEKLPSVERSTKIRTSRDLLAFAVPMPNRCIAVVSSDYKAYVVIEMDRFVFSKSFLQDDDDQQHQLQRKR